LRNAATLHRCLASLYLRGDTLTLLRSPMLRGGVKIKTGAEEIRRSATTDKGRYRKRRTGACFSVHPKKKPERGWKIIHKGL